jgi:hypothetical protein
MKNDTTNIIYMRSSEDSYGSMCQINKETYFNLVRSGISIYSTISDFPPGSGHFRTEWILSETSIEYVIVGADSREDCHRYYITIIKKEVEE